MVRGGRKTPITDQKYFKETNSPPALGSSPVKPKKSRRKFKGRIKLTHISPANTITKYYNVQQNTFSSFQENVDNSKGACDDSLAVDFSHKILPKERNQFKNDNPPNQKFSAEQKTIKTEIRVPLSPSTALSQLNLNSSEKGAKSKPRLISATEISVNVQKTITEFFPVRRSIRKTRKTVLEERRRMIEEAVLSNEENGLAVRNFEGKGRGVVAARHFEKGEFVVEYAGELISIMEAQKREAIYATNENIGCYMYYFKYKNNQHCVDATAETGRLGRLLNHSRNCNLTTKIIEVNGIPRLILFAKEDIQPECELTYDYGDRSKQSLLNHPWLAL